MRMDRGINYIRETHMLETKFHLDSMAVDEKKMGLEENAIMNERRTLISK